MIGSLLSAIFRCCSRVSRLWFALVFGCAMSGAFTVQSLQAADLSAREITTQLYRVERGQPANFEGTDLTNLDLSGVDFKGAQMGGADLFGVDLSRADLTSVDLRKARLDRVTITGARFDRANLAGVSMLRPAVFSTMVNTMADEAVSFQSADLRDATVFGQFNKSNFRDANFSGADLSPIHASSFIEHIWRTEFLGSDLRGVNFRGARLERVLFAFADLTNADFTGANMRHADLSGADLRGANLSNADVTNADFTDVKLQGVIGLETVVGIGALRGRSPKGLVVRADKRTPAQNSSGHKLYRTD